MSEEQKNERICAKREYLFVMGLHMEGIGKLRKDEDF